MESAEDALPIPEMNHQKKEVNAMLPTDIRYQNYIQVLREELVPAMGCTEPIALAYAAAKAREVFGGMPDHVTAWCSGNIIKNVRCVTIPNSGNMMGIEAGVTL